MDMTALSPTEILVGVLSAALLAGLKALAPTLQKRVPNFLWPLAAVVLARLGAAICQTAGASCSGNPLNWTSVESTALATAFVAVLAREVAVYGKGAVQKLAAAVSPTPGPSALP